MNIHEYQAKQLFNHFGIATPLGKPVTSTQQVKQVLEEIGGDNWVIKAQVHAGGRGKAGGVCVVRDVAEAESVAGQLLGNYLVTPQTAACGLPVDSVLIETTGTVRREFYLSLLVDRTSEKLMFIASVAGGMEIETVARETPEKILMERVKTAGLQSYQCRKIGYALGLKGKQIADLEGVMRGMLQLFVEKDASQVEINPLIETDNGMLLALDAKINFDDNALPLHDDVRCLRDGRQENDKEQIAEQFGLNYISLGGTIGCMVNGAGLAMATMDLIKLKGGEPANFLDVGGGTTPEKVAEAFRLILSDEKVKSILVNIFGGIVHCNVIAEGILHAVRDMEVAVPIVVRLEGTHAELGRELLNNSELAVIAANDLEIAAAKAVHLAGGV